MVKNGKKSDQESRITTIEKVDFQEFVSDFNRAITEQTCADLEAEKWPAWFDEKYKDIEELDDFLDIGQLPQSHIDDAPVSESNYQECKLSIKTCPRRKGQTKQWRCF